MKKLILAVTMLAIAATTTFVACKKDEVKQQTKLSNTIGFQMNARNVNVTLFDDLINTNSLQLPLSLDTFTEYLSNIGLVNILINSKSSSSITFEIATTLNFANGDPYLFNGKGFTINKINNNFVLSSVNSDFTLFVNPESNELIYQNGSVSVDLNNRNENSNISETALKELPVFLGLAEMFTKLNITTTTPVKPNSSGKYAGTAVGLHKSRANADVLCTMKHQKILNDHPDWWSPDVSVSCLFDNHICVCTADYYTK